MRDLFTITRYELLMQLKSIRFKGLCVLILLADVAIYMAGLKMQELSVGIIFFEKALVFYLPAVVFAGLFSVGRIRSLGMHSILMVRPYNTFILVLGQLIAAVLSCIVPLFLFLFPSGLMLRWQYEMDFPLPPLLYASIFFFIPSFFCVLAITIWVRTCFKNNLVSIIILAIIFAAAVVLGRTPLVNARSPEGQSVHNFVPLISVFSQTYWRDLRNILPAPSLRFFQIDQWARFVLSIICSGIFLILACYHLRRTEPHRKVIGNYGRRWYHTPTFLRIACDLKMDPHMTWRTHLVLALFVAIIVFKVVLPLNLPIFRDLNSTLAFMFRPEAKEARAQTPVERILSGGFQVPDIRRMTDQKLFAPTMLHDEQYMSLDKYVSQMAFTLNGDPRGKVAAMITHNRFVFQPRSVSLDGKPVPFAQGEYFFLDGNSFASCRDGKIHHLTIEAKPFGAKIRDIPGSFQFSISGYYFCDMVKQYMDDSSGELRNTLHSSQKKLCGVDLTLVLPSEAKVLHVPSKPLLSRQKKMTTYKFRAQSGLRPPSRGIYIAMSDDYRILNLPDSTLKIQFAIHRSYEKLMRDLLALERPVLEEFYALHRIPSDADIFLMFDVAQESDQGRQLKIMRTMLTRYRTRGFRNGDEAGRVLGEMAAWEEGLLNSVFYRYMSVSNLPGDPWDLYAFIQKNFKCGLNRSISPKRQFQSGMYWPNPPPDVKSFQKLYTLPRKDIFSGKIDLPRIPVFQMLCYQMGQDNWLRMVDALKTRLKKEDLTVDLLEQVANQFSPQPMNEFFDYWCRTGKGFPSYKVVKATARILPDAAEDGAQYEVEAQIQNVGTGRMQLPVMLWTAKESANVSDKIWIGPGETVTWKTTCKFMPKSVVANAFSWVCAAPYYDEKTKKMVTESMAPVKIEKQD